MLPHLVLMMGLAIAVAPVVGQSADTIYVRIETELGNVRVALFADEAPVTVDNFLYYATEGHYEGGSFFRTVHAENQPDNDIRIAVIQAGVHPWMENFSREPIPLERTSETGLLHVDGAISMARGGPDTATSSFFICVGDQPELDFGGRRNPDGQGFAVFGQVVDGMDVVHQIHRAQAKGQAIVPPVRIAGVSVEGG